jgi:type IV secretion system protein VirB1
MPDHRIGISLDVKNGATRDLQQGFESVAKSADTIKQRFADLDRAANNLVRQGWGSQQYTQELRQQLQILQQMATLAERQAGRIGNAGVQTDLHGIGKRIGGSMSDVGAVSGVSMPASSDMLRSATTIVATALASTLAVTGMKLLYQGWQSNVSMLPAFANMGKTMAPGGGNMGWAQSMLRAGQGYGYTNQQILSGAQTIQGATGNTPDFFNQIRGVAQFGRTNGFDYQQSANYFAGAYQSGVTGGSSAQMSWQEYAILVANTVNAGNMQGRNGQVVSSLQQLTQIAQQTMVNAPNQNQVAGLYATATKGGNQGLINQLPSIMGGVNQGITSPGMGAYGQAAMWQAVAPGSDYWTAQMIESEGAFGTGKNGNTNFQNMMTYANKNFGGNSNQSADMMSQWLNGAVSPLQAKALMNTYMKNGKFDTTTFSTNQSQLQKQMQASQMQQTQQNLTNPGQTAQNLTSYGATPGAALYNGMFGNKSNLLAATVMGGLVGGKGIATWLGGALGGAAPVTEAVAPAVVAGGATAAVDTGAALGVAGGLEGAGLAADATGVGLPIGLMLALAGGGVAAGVGGMALYNHFKGKGGGGSSSGGGGGGQFDAATAAQETAAIIMAMGPYMGEISGMLGGSSGPSGVATSNNNKVNTNLVNDLNKPVSVNPGKNTSPGNGFIDWLDGSGGSGNANVSGVKPYYSQINSISSKYGVPTQVMGGIMATESGGNPYTLNDNTTGKSYSYSSQAQYTAMGQQLLGQGHSLDMGLMQINSQAHPGVTLAQAANPSFAMNYAAQMLQSDYQATGNWDETVRAYNQGLGGAQAGGGGAYLGKVQSAEKQLKVNSTGQLTITVNDASTGKQTKGMIPLTTTATTNGQTVSGSAGSGQASSPFTGQIGP